MNRPFIQAYSSSIAAALAVCVFGSVLAIVYVVKQRTESKKSKHRDLFNTCSVSAPGKALIAGGYLVLEPDNIGLVVAASARFYSTVTLSNKQEVLPESVLLLDVLSIQFRQRTSFEFNVSAMSLTCCDGPKNVFIEKCLHLVLQFISELKGTEIFLSECSRIRAYGGLKITLRGDNDFYSQIGILHELNLPRLSQSLRQIEKCRPCATAADGALSISKTGMGSSAALTTSLVGALLHFFNVIKLGHRKADEDKRVVHNLSQLVHGIAQGKIGSGFDVAAAVYGSLVYRRFDPKSLMSFPSNPTPTEVYYAVSSLSIWNQSATSFSLPFPLDIVMGDVCGGSGSVSMAKAVLEWRKCGGQEALDIWNELSICNASIVECFSNLHSSSRADPVQFQASLDFISSHAYAAWESENVVTAQLLEIKILFRKIRMLLKSMGKKSGVDIEPDVQTRLVDATDEVPGVLCAGVPGAGGVDAIFCIVTSGSSRAAVEQLWSEWSDVTVCPLLLSSDSGPFQGVRLELIE